MSRRALEHQVDKDRARAAALAAEGIVPAEPPAVDPEGCMPYRCNRVTMDLGHVLHSNICESLYFREACSALKEFSEVVDEIYSYVEHLEPFVKVGDPHVYVVCA